MKRFQKPHSGARASSALSTASKLLRTLDLIRMEMRGGRKVAFILVPCSSSKRRLSGIGYIRRETKGMILWPSIEMHFDGSDLTERSVTR